MYKFLLFLKIPIILNIHFTFNEIDLFSQIPSTYARPISKACRPHILCMNTILW